MYKVEIIKYDQEPGLEIIVKDGAGDVVSAITIDGEILDKKCKNCSRQIIYDIEAEQISAHIVMNGMDRLVVTPNASIARTEPTLH